jgi:hypothetical protein
MSGISDFERLQITSLLSEHTAPIEPNLALHLMPQTNLCRYVFDVAVIPAMARNDLNVQEMDVIFDSDSTLADAVATLTRAEVVVMDLSDWLSDLAYLLGLCHALGRCPILIGRRHVNLPFNLRALRCIEYRASQEGYLALREELTRTLRIFLTASRATRSKES